MRMIMTTGKVSNRRVFVDALKMGLPERTYPDGLCIDNEEGFGVLGMTSTNQNRLS